MHHIIADLYLISSFNDFSNVRMMSFYEICVPNAVKIGWMIPIVA